MEQTDGQFIIWKTIGIIGFGKSWKIPIIFDQKFWVKI